MRRLLSFRSEVRPVFRLGLPIALMQLGMVFFTTMTTMLVGRIGPEAIAGVGMGNALYFMMLVSAMGFLLGIDPLASRAFGAGRPADCAKVLFHAVILGLLAGIPVFIGVSFARPIFGLVGVDPAVADAAAAYLRILRWHIFLALSFTACRQYLQAMGITKPQLAAVILGNMVNGGLGWLLIFGHGGLPAFGIRGAALGAISAYCCMLAIAAWAARRRVKASGFRWTGFDPSLLKDLLRIGVPAGIQLSLEVAAFGVSTMLMGRIGAVAVAAHQIVLNMASMTFMVSMGISHAAAVLVGQGLGRHNPLSSARAGWAALVLTIGFMGLASLVFMLMPGTLMRLYTEDPTVIALGVTLLAAAAAFQLFDGVQIVMTGALRGLGETRLPMLANLFGHWMLGIPFGAFTAFKLGVGPLGIWLGLCLGLGAVASSLFLVWYGRARELARRHIVAGPHPDEAFDLAAGEGR